MKEKIEKQPENIQDITQESKGHVCKYCALNLPNVASVSSKCGRDQTAWRNHFRIDHIGLLIAFLAIFFGYLQFREARQDRREASEALQIAKGSEQSVKKLNRVVSEAESQLGDLKSLTDFSLTEARANNDNRSAFNRLLEIQKNNGPLQRLAGDAIARIITEIDPMINIRIDPKPDWEKLGITIESATLEELIEVFNIIHPNVRPYVLGTIWTQDRFSECQRLSFLADVIRDNQSLRVLHRACILMNKISKINKNILGANLYLKWWDEYKSKCNQ